MKSASTISEFHSQILFHLITLFWLYYLIVEPFIGKLYPEASNTMKIRAIAILMLICLSISSAAEKSVYIPSSKRNAMDFSKTSSQFCYERSKESDNIAVFWESGFGSNPSAASGNLRVNMDSLLLNAEKAYSFYLDTLKFAIKGSSVSDINKLVIFLFSTSEWTANGSGEDDKVACLSVNYAAAKIANVVAHEIGHCFQYITGCDGDGGYRYGFGANTSGGNGFWEQCANWMSFKVYPDKQFTESDFSEYIKNNHLNIIHEAPRYANYFLPDFWTYKNDITFMGRLWRDSRTPEDPVETYKRLCSLTQEQFNDLMYEHAAKLTTWDLPAIKSRGAKYIDSRAQVKMKLTSDNFWLVDSSVCIENYGYNGIKLNAPSASAKVSAHFQGKAGAKGFRAKNIDKGGWRFGFVALLEDGTRVYSDMDSAVVQNGNNPEETIEFDCPANCSKLWFIVSGSPQEYWRHAWDDDNSNDEQWPYQVQFSNTNLLGQATDVHSIESKNVSSNLHPQFTAAKISLPQISRWQIISLSGRQIASGYGNSIDISKLSYGGYVLDYAGKQFRMIKR